MTPSFAIKGMQSASCHNSPSNKCPSNICDMLMAARVHVLLIIASSGELAALAPEILADRHNFLLTPVLAAFLSRLHHLAASLNLHIGEIVRLKMGLNARRYPVPLCLRNNVMPKWTSFSHITGCTKSVNQPTTRSTPMECPINDLVCGHPKIEDLVNSFGSDRNWTSSYTMFNLPILIAAEVGELSEHFTYLELQFPTAIT